MRSSTGRYTAETAPRGGEVGAGLVQVGVRVVGPGVEVAAGVIEDAEGESIAGRRGGLGRAGVVRALAGDGTREREQHESGERRDDDARRTPWRRAKRGRRRGRPTIVVDAGSRADVSNDEGRGGGRRAPEGRRRRESATRRRPFERGPERRRERDADDVRAARRRVRARPRVCLNNGISVVRLGWARRPGERAALPRGKASPRRVG